MRDSRTPFSLRSADLSRRRAMQAAGGVAAAVLAGMPGVLVAQSTPDASPEASPGASPEASPEVSPAATSNRSPESWFVVSAQDPAGGFTTQADVFEVYSGVTLEKLGGFRAPGTIEMCVTADPGKILISQGASLSIFDLEAGKVFPITFAGEPAADNYWLPDPRVFQVAPAPYAIVRSLDATQAWIVDLERHVATELVSLFGMIDAANPYPTISFSLDGKVAAAHVNEGSSVVFDPANPRTFRKVDGGELDGMAALPQFSASGARMTYCTIPDANASTAWVVVQEVDGQEVIARIDGVDPTAFSIFLPGSESVVLIIGGGEAVVLDTESGRELATVETSPLAWAYGFSSNGNRVLVGTTQLTGEEIRWQTLDVQSGEAKDIPELEALTYYNGSYDSNNAIHTLFGPPYMAQGEEVVDALVSFNTETMETKPLLDDVSSWSLSYGYSTSADNRIALLVMYDATLMDLETGEVQVFPQITTGSSARGSFVSPDGTKAAISAWDSTGTGTQQVLMLDVAAGTTPQPFMDGVLWLWAGSIPDAQPASTSGLASATTQGWTGIHRIASRR